MRAAIVGPHNPTVWTAMRHPRPAPEGKNLASPQTPQENEKVRRKKAAVGKDRGHLRHADRLFSFNPASNPRSILPLTKGRVSRPRADVNIPNRADPAADGGFPPRTSTPGDG